MNGIPTFEVEQILIFWK